MADIHPIPGFGADPIGSRFSAVRGGGRIQSDDPAVHEAVHNRKVNARMARAMEKQGNRGGADISMATMRPQDPMFYWQQNNLPYDVNKPDQLEKIRGYCRVVAETHPLIGSAIEIYSKYPLTGMEFTSKDKAITDFYNTHFIDQLNYEEYLVDVGREYWTVGEAWPLGTFNDLLGVWEDDELMPPENVVVKRSPFLKEPRLYMKLPPVILDVLEKREPVHEYQQLIAAYPELAKFAVGAEEQQYMLMSNVLLKQLRFKTNVFRTRGTPILLKAFRALMQEEMLNAAVDAVASRLYMPLLLTKLGASATDLGTSQPWIPNEGDIEAFEEAVDAALAADYRMITHHFAVDMTHVLGREVVPDLSGDFERLEERELQVFGLSKTMLSGASGGQTYAADALNRDLITQLLTTFQNMVKAFTRERCLVVAEAQEHFDYEERGGKKYPIMEEVLEVDPESGKQRIVEQPKLLVPDLEIRSMNMRDDTTYRQLLEALADKGVPISGKTRLVNVPIDFEDEREAVIEETVEAGVAFQEARKRLYLELRERRLPIPEDLIKDFAPKVQEQGGGNAPASTPQDPQTIGNDAIVAPPGDSPMVPPEGVGGQGSNVIPLPRMQAPGQSQRPPESDEQRQGMPRATGSLKSPDTDDESVSPGEPAMGSPKHLGSRRKAVEDGRIGRDKPLPGQDDEVG